MIKKSIRKLTSYIKDMYITYPKDFDMYEPLFKINNWTVKKDTSIYASRSIDIYFKGSHVAKTFLKEKEGRISYEIFDGIEIIKGFESLRPEISKVLYAASRIRYNQLIQETKKRQELIKQAKTETRFLGPFR